MSLFLWMVILLSAIFNPLKASGWDNPIMGLRALSMNAAFAAVADDPSAIYHNPAGIVQCSKGWTLQAEGVYLMPHHFARLEEGKVAESQRRAFVPQGFLVLRQGRGAIGFGIYTPFGGGGIDFPKKDLGEGIRADLGVLSVSGVVSRRLSENLLLGGGISMLVAQNRATVINDQGETDILERGRSWRVTAGLIIRPSEKASFGVSFKGPTSIRLRGTTHIPFPDDTFPSETWISLPYSFSIGIAWISSRRSLFSLEVERVGWSVLDSVRGEIYDVPGFISGVPKGQALGFQNTIKIKFGSEWWPSNRISLRAGIAYDPAAADSRFLSPTNIDVHKVAISLGLGILKGSSQFNIALVKASGRERRTESGEEPGTYNLDALVLGVGALFAF